MNFFRWTLFGLFILTHTHAAFAMFHRKVLKEQGMAAVYAQSEEAAQKFPYANNIGMLFSETSELGTATLLAPDLAITCAHHAMLRTEGQKQVFVAASKCFPPISGKLSWKEAIQQLKPGTFSTYTVHSFGKMEDKPFENAASVQKAFDLLEGCATDLCDPKKLLQNLGMTVDGKHLACKGRDIALLKLDMPIQEEISPIPLYCPKQDEPPCRAVLIGGLGLQMDAQGGKHARTAVMRLSKKRSHRVHMLGAALCLVEQNLTWCPSAHSWFSKWKILNDEPSNFVAEQSEGFTGSVYSGLIQEGQSGGPIFLKKGENWVLSGLVSLDIYGSHIRHSCTAIYQQCYGDAPPEEQAFIMQQLEKFRAMQFPLYNVFSAPTKKVIKTARTLAKDHTRIIEHK